MSRESLTILTCSMARDAALFALLARSVDECAAADIPHKVVVPGRDMDVFRPFANARREIIAQEDVLPFRIYKLPGALKYLAPLAPSFRRPVYVNNRLSAIRGWILQQLLKIEMSRTATQAQVLHVDSDVFFFRPMQAGDTFTNGRPRFFFADGATGNPLHGGWIEAAGRMLGITPDPAQPRHYVENCVPWASEVVRGMTQRISETHGRPWYEVLLGEETLSEYYIYGLYVDHLCGTGTLAPDPMSFCHSYWPDTDDAPMQADAHVGGLDPRHFAMAVQSTHPLSVADRVAMYEKARARSAA